MSTRITHIYGGGLVWIWNMEGKKLNLSCNLSHVPMCVYTSACMYNKNHTIDEWGRLPHPIHVLSPLLTIPEGKAEKQSLSLFRVVHGFFEPCQAAYLPGWPCEGRVGCQNSYSVDSCAVAVVGQSEELRPYICQGHGIHVII